MMPESKVKKVQQNTLRQSVWQELREAIVRGALPPGSQINQALLAEQFGVSRGPLREALSLLEEEGLVRNIPYRGTFVAEFDVDTVEDTYSLRQVLELYAVERAIARSSTDQLARLRATFEQMEAAGDDQDMELFYKLDLEFHRQLYMMADHELLLEIWKMIEANVMRGIFRGTLTYHLYTLPELLEEHRRILEALERGDVETAKRETGAHIRDGGARLIARWKALQNDAVDPTQKGH